MLHIRAKVAARYGGTERQHQHTGLLANAIVFSADSGGGKGIRARCVAFALGIVASCLLMSP